jgi:hypothetical protein
MAEDLGENICIAGTTILGGAVGSLVGVPGTLLGAAVGGIIGYKVCGQPFMKPFRDKFDFISAFNSASNDQTSRSNTVSYLMKNYNVKDRMAAEIMVDYAVSKAKENIDWAFSQYQSVAQAGLRSGSVVHGTTNIANTATKVSHSLRA